MNIPCEESMTESGHPLKISAALVFLLKHVMKNGHERLAARIGSALDVALDIEEKNQHGRGSEAAFSNLGLHSRSLKNKLNP